MQRCYKFPPTPLSEHKVMGTAHGPFLARLRYFLLRRYIYLQFTPPSAIHEKFNKNERTLRLRWMRGRLELTVPPCIESSYLLASDIPTKWLATRQQSRGCAKTASRFLTAHTLRLHWKFHDPFPCRTEPLWASSQAARDGDRHFYLCCFPRTLHSEERGRINETNYYYSIMSPPHTCS